MTLLFFTLHVFAYRDQHFTNKYVPSYLEEKESVDHTLLDYLRSTLMVNSVPNRTMGSDVA